MKRFVVLAGAAALALSVASSAFAAEVKLVGVTYPEGKKISVPFTRTAIAPKAATLEGTLRMEKGQVDVKIAWKMMEPAVMFAGNITTCNVWAITADGRPENLGELQVREKKSGEGSFRTGKEVSAILAVLPKVQVRAEGFTDTTGKEELNMKLSAERARAVADFLAAQGVAADRLTHAGYGPANPVGDNATAEGRAKNRRVELILAEGTVKATEGGMVAPALPAKATRPAAKPAAKPAAAPATK